MTSIEEKVSFAASQAASHAQRKEIVEAKIDELKNKIKASELERGLFRDSTMHLDFPNEEVDRSNVAARGKRRR